MKKKVQQKLINLLLWILRKLGWKEKPPKAYLPPQRPIITESYGLTPVKMRIRVEKVRSQNYYGMEEEKAKEWTAHERSGHREAARRQILKEISSFKDYEFIKIIKAEDGYEYACFEFFINKNENIHG